MKFKINRVNHITIPAPHDQEDKMRWFYEDVLGFEEIQHPASLDTQYKVIWYDKPNIRIHIDMTPPFVPCGISRHFCVEVDDIEEARQYLKSKKATIKEDVPVPYGYRFDIVDPFGNYIEILQLKKKN